MKNHQPIPLDLIFKSAWRDVKGAKFPFFLSFFALMVTELIIYFVTSAYQLHVTQNWTNNILHIALPALFIAPLLTGLAMMGVERFRSPPLHAGSGFKYYRIMPHVFVAFIMSAILLWVLFLLVSLGGIFILSALHTDLQFHFRFDWVLFGSLLILLLLFGVYKTFMIFNFILVADKGVNPFVAWWKSMIMAAPHFGKIYLALIYVFIFNLLGICLLGVGLLWTIPWTYLVFGRIYLFCCDEKNMKAPVLDEE